MDAREKFEKLGYTNCYEDALIISYRKYNDRQNFESIKFIKPEGIKGIIAVDENLQPKKITMEELKAINRKCEELRWI